MSTPGAVISGLSPSSTKRGPRLEKSASWSLRSTAPTVRAASAAPGVPTVKLSGPLLPAAMTKRAPVSALSSSTATLIGSVPSVGSPPRLMLMTLALRSRAAHSMPAMIQESWPEPLLSRTLPISSSAPGATPFSTPPDAAPVPAIVEATCVPCPCRSVTSSPGTKLWLASTLPTRSGCSVSTPVSSTATSTPWPASPPAHTEGAPIWATSSAKAACTLPSSHTLVIPSAKLPVPVVSEDQNSPA